MAHGKEDSDTQHYTHDKKSPRQFPRTRVNSKEFGAWKHLVTRVLKRLQGKALIEHLYANIEHEPKVSDQRFSKPKVRQTLELSEDFVKVDVRLEFGVEAQC